jgi:hypothetical protein
MHSSMTAGDCAGTATSPERFVAANAGVDMMVSSVARPPHSTSASGPCFRMLCSRLSSLSVGPDSDADVCEGDTHMHTRTGYRHRHQIQTQAQRRRDRETEGQNDRETGEMARTTERQRDMEIGAAERGTGHRNTEAHRQRRSECTSRRRSDTIGRRQHLALDDLGPVGVEGLENRADSARVHHLRGVSRKRCHGSQRVYGVAAMAAVAVQQGRHANTTTQP